MMPDHPLEPGVPQAGWLARMHGLVRSFIPSRQGAVNNQSDPRHTAAPTRPEQLLSPAPSGHGAARLLTPGEAFTPTRPKAGRRRLIGRRAELLRILQILQEDRAHVVLYAERGRGKTSLANLVTEVLRRSGTLVARHTCDAGTTYDDLMRSLMRDLPPSLLIAPVTSHDAQAAPVANDVGCGAALPAGRLRPADILALPHRLNCKSLVCVIDEFDRVLDPETRIRLADTIKQLSDRGVPLLFMIVGVSDTLEQILGQHPSIQRSVIGVHLPLFSEQEVRQLVIEGAHEAGLEFPPAAVACVLWVARGMPYMAQLLALRLAQAAAGRGDGTITEADFEEAVFRLTANAPAHVATLYAALTRHERDTEMMAALRQIASAPQDLWGRLRVTQASDGSVAVAACRISPAIWQRLQAAQVLLEPNAGSDLFVFAERGLMHHVLLLTAGEIVQDFLVREKPPADNFRTASSPHAVPGSLSRTALQASQDILASLEQNMTGEAR